MAQQNLPDYESQIKQGDWNSGMCSCCDDIGICCMQCFCPCVQSAFNKANADFRACTPLDCLCSMCTPHQEWFTRKQIRSYYGLPEPCKICLCCVLPCVSCQNARELQIRRGENLGKFVGGRPPAPEPQKMAVLEYKKAWPQPVNGQFTTSLFDCFSDINSCFLVYCCVCKAVAANKADVDGRAVDMCDCWCVPSEYWTREQLKAKWGIQESNCVGCVLTCLPGVSALAIAQDRREIMIRRKADATGTSAGVAMTGQ